MSRRHNTRHERTPGGYKRRLAKRGLARSPMTPFTAPGANAPAPQHHPNGRRR